MAPDVWNEVYKGYTDINMLNIRGRSVAYRSVRFHHGWFGAELEGFVGGQNRLERICFIISSYASKESCPSFSLSNRCELTFENAGQPFLLARI